MNLSEYIGTAGPCSIPLDLWYLEGGSVNTWINMFEPIRPGLCHPPIRCLARAAAARSARAVSACAGEGAKALIFETLWLDGFSGDDGL